MSTPSTADLPGPAATMHVGNTSETKVSYAQTLKANPRPQELAERAARKAFIHGINSNVIGKTTTINGRKTIFISNEEDEFMAAPYQYSLMGKFSHGYQTMTRLRAKFVAVGLLKGFKIGVLDNKHVWIKLLDPNDYARIWMKQVWYFDGFPMRVLKWTRDFDPREESPIMPIWIKVLGLKPHWFHRKFLFHVASLIGKPLKLDEATTEIDNPSLARICVEVNVMENLISEIPIQMEGKSCVLKIQYEGIPEYCKVCRHRGHSMTACLIRKDKDEVTNQNVEKGDKDDAQEWRGNGDLRARLDKMSGKRHMVNPIILIRNMSTDNFIEKEKKSDANNVMESLTDPTRSGPSKFWSDQEQEGIEKYKLDNVEGDQVQDSDDRNSMDDDHESS
ncbi:hypothetical protein BUALT_Bualt14G0077100 [Buddleja alternifolia]|uniref:DUF4283 domain-containing protein n=1 Tax=Buddleja alternifolia TaxID=168488 RepID=A0AAV6WHH9_9LAMI|nr:hypothetical protein BUALT_Bualt14G0077100 [Buddleja alternifolia]